MMRPGDSLRLTIEKPAAGGRMLARADGQVVLVAGAIPGERIDAVVERAGKGVIYARTTAVLEPSLDRRAVAGNPLCGGCLFAHVQYARQLALKSEIIVDAFRRIGHIDLPAPQVAASQEEGYRMRARLHVRGGAMGFFLEGTHAICGARQTRQLLPATVDVLDRTAAMLQSLAIPYGEVDLAENGVGSSRVLYLDMTPPIGPGVAQHLASIDGITGVSWPGGSHGPIHVDDTVTAEGRPFALRRHVLAFFQGNRYLLDAFVSHVVGHVDAGARVIDLYAGVGLFSVAAARSRGATVTAVEGDRVGAADLAANAQSTGGAVEAVHESVEAFTATAGTHPTATVVVDPPRTGMSREALEGVLSLGARKIVYVSCDLATLARDARRLIDGGGYRLRQLQAFDLFPNTAHVESVGEFEK